MSRKLGPTLQPEQYATTDFDCHGKGRQRVRIVERDTDPLFLTGVKFRVQPIGVMSDPPMEETEWYDASWFDPESPVTQPDQS